MAALNRYRKSRNPFSGDPDPNRAGNGCIMRLAPVPMFCFPDLEAAIALSAESSRTTHGAAECLDCCGLLGAMLHAALGGAAKQDLLLRHAQGSFASRRVAQLARRAYRGKSPAGIRGGFYVVECLEAVHWCFDRTESFESAILEAANLGDDADTTAAVCGQHAGAYHGEEAIPGRWLRRVVMREEIAALARALQVAVP
jgi:ADP-ribosyl-[dinitrogen reductase] hydrolase